MAIARAGERVHPVFALWPVAMAGPLADFLASGVKPRLMDFAAQAALADFPDDGSFDNLNTPDDLAVAEALLQAVAMSRFDSVAVVVWSAASALSPARPSPDAIWIGRNGQESRYFRGRALAEAALRDLSAQELAAGRRLLIGFDFPFGYPAGFAARLTGEASARAVWSWLAARIMDAAK